MTRQVHGRQSGLSRVVEIDRTERIDLIYAQRGTELVERRGNWSEDQPVTVAERFKHAAPNRPPPSAGTRSPQFYRRAYLRYIDATKRSPDRRQARIAEVVALLAAGTEQRPKPSDTR